MGVGPECKSTLAHFLEPKNLIYRATIEHDAQFAPFIFYCNFLKSKCLEELVKPTKTS